MKPWQRKMWCIPPEQDAEFVCAMESVLEVYMRPYDATRPVLCLDEKSKQLVAETRAPIPARRGEPERCDYEYSRNGTANIFMMVEPLRGWRHVDVTARRTQGRLRASGARPRRRALSACRADHAGDGQPEHAPDIESLRGVRAGGGAAADREDSPLKAPSPRPHRVCIGCLNPISTK